MDEEVSKEKECVRPLGIKVDKDTVINGIQPEEGGPCLGIQASKGEKLCRGFQLPDGVCIMADATRRDIGLLKSAESFKGVPGIWWEKGIVEGWAADKC
jgi:hypothetical protein